MRAGLTLRLSELWTGRPVEDGVTALGSFGERPVRKPGGVFVFTGESPECVRIKSKAYSDTELTVTSSRARLFLVRRDEAGCRLSLKPGETVRLLLPGLGGYSPSSDAEPGDTEIALYKTDFKDITWQYHAPVFRDSGGLGEPFMITGHKGHGVYTLDHSLDCRLTRFGCVIAPMFTLTADSAGELAFPLPEGEISELAVYRDGAFLRLPLVRGEINCFKLEG